MTTKTDPRPPLSLDTILQPKVDITPKVPPIPMRGRSMYHPSNVSFEQAAEGLDMASFILRSNCQCRMPNQGIRHTWGQFYHFNPTEQPRWTYWGSCQHIVDKKFTTFTRETPFATVEEAVLYGYEYHLTEEERGQLKALLAQRRAKLDKAAARRAKAKPTKLKKKAPAKAVSKPKGKAKTNGPVSRRRRT